MTQKQRFSNNLAHIHSKPVVYSNNGGGRDTYISQNSGGLRVIHQPAQNKRTYYGSLREYPQIDNYAKRLSGHMASSEERGDTFSASQNHWSPDFNSKNRLVGQYQNMMDRRLSKPKALK